MFSQNQESEDGRLLTGMTRNTTPVPLQYPTRPNGRQVSARTSLQYANPEQLNAAQYQQAVLSGFTQQQPAYPHSGYYNDPNPYTMGEPYDGSENAQGQQNEYTSSNTTEGQGAETNQSFTQEVKKPEGGQGTPGKPPLYLWFCCHCKQGPYDFAIYDACVVGCGRARCSDCRIESVQSK